MRLISCNTARLQFYFTFLNAVKSLQCDAKVVSDYQGENVLSTENSITLRM